jgi:thiol-disulfide isomerase/thioredoxin/outer membrane lipoprotein-sorting protein
MAAGLYAQDAAADILQQVLATYKNLTTYRIEQTSENFLTSELHHSWQKEFTVLAEEQPGKVRFEYTGQSSAYVVVADGKTLWRATPYIREWSRAAFTGPLSEVRGGGAEAETALRQMRAAMNSHARILDDLQSAEIIRDETLEVGGDPIECTVIRADYNPPRGSIGIRTVMRTYWVDKKRHIILQNETVTRGNLMPDAPFVEMESRWMIRVTHASIGEPLPANYFSYTAPANFRELDKLERAHPRPATSLLGKPAPGLALKTLDGKELALSSLRGKTVLLDFWATWCEPCRMQMGALAELYQEMKGQDAVLIGIDDDPDPETALKFMLEHQYGWTSLFSGPKGDAREKYSVDGIPTLVLIDRNGAVVEYQVGSGATTEKAIRSALRMLGIQVRE